MAAAAGMPRTFRTVTRKPDDLAAILYTSGTTGRSKGAMLSHGNLAHNAQVLNEYWGWRQDDVLLHMLPIFTCTVCSWPRTEERCSRVRA